MASKHADENNFNPMHDSENVDKILTTNREEETTLWAHDVFQLKSSHSPGASVDKLTAKNERLVLLYLQLLNSRTLSSRFCKKHC
jgi:hypothetical protein